MLADETSPLYMGGMFQTASAAVHAQDQMEDRFRSGDGLGWHEHHHDLFHGTDAVFGVAYRTYLVQEWIPALDGVEAKLRAGARVADVGCGYGTATIVLAQAFPQSTFVGFDYHVESIERRPGERGRRRRRGPRAVRDRVGDGLPRHRLRPDRDASTRCTTSATRPRARGRCARRWPTTARG